MPFGITDELMEALRSGRRVSAIGAPLDLSVRRAVRLHQAQCRAYLLQKDRTVALNTPRRTEVPQVRAARAAPILDDRTAAELLHIAYHEAAHGVVSLVCDGRPTRVTIERTASTEGRCVWDPTRVMAEAEIAIYASGAYATRKRQGGTLMDTDDVTPSDAQAIRRIAGRDARLELAGICLALELVDSHWPAIQRVADALMQQTTLNAADIQRLTNDWSRTA